MMQVILAALMAMGAKIVTSEFIEFVILLAAKALVKKTDNQYDDQLVAEIEKLLGHK